MTRSWSRSFPMPMPRAGCCSPTPATRSRPSRRRMASAARSASPDPTCSENFHARDARHFSRPKTTPAAPDDERGTLRMAQHVGEWSFRIEHARQRLRTCQRRRLIHDFPTRTQNQNGPWPAWQRGHLSRACRRRTRPCRGDRGRAFSHDPGSERRPGRWAESNGSRSSPYPSG